MATTKTRAPSTRRISVAKYISDQIDLCGKSQKEIAQEIGFDKPNVISMIKKGATKVPHVKIYKMAKALEVDPVYFFKLCMDEYNPEFSEVIEQIVGGKIISDNEYEFVQVLRSANAADHKLKTSQKAELKAQLTKMFK